MACRSGPLRRDGGMKDTIQLTNEERLQLKNIDLERRLVMTQTTLIEVQTRETAARIGERLGVDLTQYRLDVETGKGELVQRVRGVPDESEESEEATG